MASIVAAIVPVSDEAEEALKRGRNSVLVMSTSELPDSLKSAVEADCHGECYPNVIVYDVARVHTGSRKGMTFGRKRTSTVQLLGPAIEETHLELSLGPTSCSLWLDNKSTQGLLAASEPGKKVDLAPSAVFELTAPTTVTMGSHGFRIYPNTATVTPAHSKAPRVQEKHASLRDDGANVKRPTGHGRTHAKSSAVTSSSDKESTGPTLREPASTQETAANRSRAGKCPTITPSDDEAALFRDEEHTSTPPTRTASRGNIALRPAEAPRAATVTGGAKRKIEVGPGDAGDEMGEVEEPPAKRIHHEDQREVGWFGAISNASVIGLSAFAVAQRFVG